LAKLNGLNVNRFETGLSASVNGALETTGCFRNQLMCVSGQVLMMYKVELWWEVTVLVCLYNYSKE